MEIIVISLRPFSRIPQFRHMELKLQIKSHLSEDRLRKGNNYLVAVRSVCRAQKETKYTNKYIVLPNTVWYFGLRDIITLIKYSKNPKGWIFPTAVKLQNFCLPYGCNEKTQGQCFMISNHALESRELKSRGPGADKRKIPGTTKVGQEEISCFLYIMDWQIFP